MHLLVGLSFMVTIGLLFAGLLLVGMQKDYSFVAGGLAWVAAAIALLATVKAAAIRPTEDKPASSHETSRSARS